MRILIGYDGSAHSDAALDDLKLAGLPRNATSVVVTVADALADSLHVREVAQAMPSGRVMTVFNRPQTESYESVKEAEELAVKAAERLRSHFPEWEIETRSTSGRAAWELIEAANDWNPDLIVVGSEGQSASERILLGSVSNRVVTEASHSVRVARSVERKKEGAPPKVIVGIDGSPAAEEAVNEVGRRAWPKGTQIRLIVAHPQPLKALVPSRRSTAWEMVDDPDEDAARRAESMLSWASDELKSVSSNISVSIQGGDPKRILLREARKWGADCIFVGSRNFASAFERFQLGSVSTAVVTDAPCSVEVVRVGEQQT